MTALFFSVFCLLFLGPHPGHMDVPGLVVKSELQLVAYAYSYSNGRIGAESVTHTTGHGNTRSLTHRARPGIEPTTSWMLVRFVSAALQWKLWQPVFSCLMHLSKIVECRYFIFCGWYIRYGDFGVLYWHLLFLLDLSHGAIFPSIFSYFCLRAFCFLDFMYVCVKL